MLTTASHPNVYAAAVSLQRAFARREGMATELAKAGISAEIVGAIDVRLVDETELRSECPGERPWDQFSIQNVACTLSHALVPEDDGFIAPDPGNWLREMNWSPAGADVVRFERRRSDGFDIVLGGKPVHHRGRAMHRMSSPHSGSAGCILPQNTARAFPECRPLDMTADQRPLDAAVSLTARRTALVQVQPAMVKLGNDPIPEQAAGIWRTRTTAKTPVRQKLRCGISEQRSPSHRLARALTRSARPTLIRFVPAALSGPGRNDVSPSMKKVESNGRPH